MRLWSIHPGYLDSRGLVALWREGLLALAVLEEKTAGYRNHPQLIRFRSAKDPVKAIHAYLTVVREEAILRGFSFDGSKIRAVHLNRRLPVTKGQLLYEAVHLERKLAVRDPVRYTFLKNEIRRQRIEAHPIFRLIEGEPEEWEKIPEIKGAERKAS